MGGTDLRVTCGTTSDVSRIPPRASHPLSTYPNKTGATDNQSVQQEAFGNRAVRGQERARKKNHLMDRARAGAPSCGDNE